MTFGRTGADATRPAVVAAALLVAQQMAAKSTRDALFLSNFDVSALPLMTVAGAVASLLAALLFARGLAALSPARLVPAALGTSAALFLGEWGLALTLPRAAAVVVYLHHAIVGAVLLSSFWSLVNERFDPYTAKRAMGSIGAGASFGGVIGGLITWRAASHVSLPTMLVGLAGASLLSLHSVLRLKPAGLGPASSPTAPPGEPKLAEATAPSGLRLIRDVPYLRSIALLIALGAFLEAVLDYLLNAAAAASFAKGAPLVSFFALFHTVSGVLALAVQSTLVRPSLHGLGLAGTLAIQPAFAAIGAALALFSPRSLLAAVGLRGGQAVLRSSLFRSSYELLYTPLPAEQKRPTKLIVDVGCDRLGTVAGSAAVMVVLMLAPTAPTSVLLVLALFAAGLVLALTPRFHSGYVGALAANLRSGAVSLEEASVVDATTRLTLASVRLERPGRVAEAGPAEPASTAAPPDALTSAIADLRSGKGDRIRRVLEGAELDLRLVSHVVPLLSHDELFRVAVESLRRAADRCTGQLVDVLLDPGQEPVVRRRIPRVLKGVPTQRSAEGLLLGLADERFDLRYRCAQALLRLRALPGITLPRERILDTAVREIAHAAESSRHLDHVFTLLALVLDREPLEIALLALRSGDGTMRGTALEYLDNVLPAPVREKLWPHLGGAQRLARSGRTPDQVRDDLLRSTASVAYARQVREA